MQTSKLIVIGLDGATFDLIQPFIAQGKLPTFKKLMDGGAWSELRSTVPPVTASAWSSFMTGKNPGAHGLFDFMQRRDNSYDLAPVSARDRDGKVIWDLLADAGKKVIVMNVPVTWPPSPVNGALITGMLTPRNAENYTYPKELAEELKSAIGDYIVYSDEVYSKGRGEILLNALKYSADQRVRAAEYLLQKYPWDFFMLVFPETDTVAHGLWSAYDPTHHEHDPAEAAKFRDGILEIYQHIDGLLARLLNVIASGAKQSPSRDLGIASSQKPLLAMTEPQPPISILLMSDHGHGPVRNFLYVNNFLAQRGYLKFKPNTASQLKRAAFQLGLTPRTIYQLLLTLGFGKLRRTLDKRRGGRGLLKRFFLSFADVDWSRTRAYSIGYIGEVHVNLRGREPQGIVNLGEEYERVRDDVINSLRELRLPPERSAAESKDGAPLVEHIWKKEEIYHGAHLADAPDILFLPRNLETIAFGDFEFGSNKVIEKSFGVSSSHRMNGMLIASGAGVKRAGEFRGAQIIDLAPTILHLMGLPVPTDMDGRVLTEALADTRAVEYGGTSEASATTTEGYSEEEEQEVIERLADLGYIS